MRISLVVPVLNEEEAIPRFYGAVLSQKELRQFDIEIVFINDGSTDSTEKVITELEASNALVKGLHFTRNFGKEAALFAGIFEASGDAVIPIDVDLQDPIEVIPHLIGKWQQGSDVVLAKRIDRTSDSWAKRQCAEWFYKLHNTISSPHIEENVGDFRLMSREVVENIRTLPERNLFMKGILSWVGGKVDIVEYKRAVRSAGNTKFNGWKLWNLALEGITSFSTVPLRVWTYIGGIIAIAALFYAVWIVLAKLLFGNPVPGYPSVIVSVLFIGGIQLIGIGVIGEYIGRIYLETKQRPRYILKQKQ